MSAETPKSPPSLRDLEEVMARSFKEAEPVANFRSLRLQPVLMPPPPTHELPQAQSIPPVSAQDDIEPDHSSEVKRNVTLRLALAASLALAALIGGWWAWQRSGATDVANIPDIKASPDAVLKTVVPPDAPAATTEAAAPAVPAIAGNNSMGEVSTELVPPTTDGLSPPRRVSTIRILVENDKEVQSVR